jgi:hypothetical protein
MKYFILIIIFVSAIFANDYKYRKLKNVKDFYSTITKKVIQLSIKHKTPPAIVLAIAGLESGYGSGYISAITGNILSLGANKGDIQLPPLKIAYCKDDKFEKILLDPIDQHKCKNLIWQLRPKSLKKDYRPKQFAGTNKNLEYFKYNNAAFVKAKLQSINDFLTIWLNKNHKYKPFKNTKIWLNERVKRDGVKTLFTLETNIRFIDKIGGKKNSFNYRKSWTKKVKSILKHTGLIPLCSKLYYSDLTFKEIWKNN